MDDCTWKLLDPDGPACSFVDPPSIQMGEYLPFWWDLDDERGVIKGKNCSEKTQGAVRTDTMQCHFRVIAP